MDWTTLLLILTSIGVAPWAFAVVGFVVVAVIVNINGEAIALILLLVAVSMAVLHYTENETFDTYMRAVLHAARD